MAVDPADILPTADFIGRWFNPEYQALQTQRQSNMAIAKTWDIVVVCDVINLTNQNTSRLKSNLVSAGILTQARADQIFSQTG